MTYALCRGRQWISAPDGQGVDQIIPPVLAVCDEPGAAWVSDCIDQAIERQTLLRNCWGWATEIRALR